MKYLNKVNAICRYGLPVIAAILFAACGDKSSDEPAPDPDPTPDPETELSFLCNVSDVTATSASISVSPIDGYTGYYYFDVMAKSEYEAQYAGNHEALIAQFEARVQEYADSYIEAGQVSSIEELMESAIASKGIAGYLYETLNPLTDYCVWACGVNLQGKVTSDVSIIGEFTTLDVEHSGMTFAIAYDPDTYQLTLTPSGDEPYVWGLLSAEDYQTYYNNSAEECIKDLVDTYVEGGVLEENLCAGPLSTSMILKATVGENVVLAAGYKDGITTGVAEYRFDFEGNPSATITGDVDTTLGGMTSAFYSNWGETPAGSGLDQATVMLSDYESMRQLYIDVWFPHGEAISGTYAINNTNEARTAIAGRITSTLNPSFYAVLNEQTMEFEQYALLESGTITISGDDMTMFYTVTVDAKSGDYSVKVSYSGMMFAASSSSVPQPAAAPAVRKGLKLSQQHPASAFDAAERGKNGHVAALAARVR